MQAWESRGGERKHTSQEGEEFYRVGTGWMKLRDKQKDEMKKWPGGSNRKWKEKKGNKWQNA